MFVFVVAKKVREGESASSGLALRIGLAIAGAKAQLLFGPLGMAKAMP
jgi:hypothetical protein